MTESKPNKYFQCISNRTSAIIYLCVFLVASLCLLIYSIFQLISNKFIYTGISIVAILYLAYALYQLLKNDKLLLEKHTKLSFLLIVIIVIVITILDYLTNKNKDSVKEKLIINICIIIIISFGMLTYNEYCKEKQEKNNHTQYNRQLEQGN
ncbi:hypothetical protein BCR32DRAFT_282374 [Anaeromyces robustus]|uniref:Uncharacterized protein n=1 Tax=Anaeromyces robustus TaxID=1754192 RepID=A0A1Y1WXQ6_9FUNG|nr:hypothetical protein BCR32DRAFT_282374 [Anaeromyces robustus]|eukprot:ORX78330.1 hypothetical protein BCR32DRAFT_282374 [Anaeromyces robustus]